MAPSLTSQPGELIFIVGGNGCGKSTLAKVITGLYPHESGATRLNGKIIGNADRIVRLDFGQAD